MISFSVTTCWKPFCDFLLCSGRLNSSHDHMVVPKVLQDIIPQQFPPFSPHSIEPHFLLSFLKILPHVTDLLYILFSLFKNVQNYSQPLNSPIKSHFEGKTVVFHTPLPQSSQIPLLYSLIVFI